VIFRSTSAGSMQQVSSTSANTGTQFWYSTGTIPPPSVMGAEMISSPGSGSRVPIATWIAAVPELEATACFMP